MNLDSLLLNTNNSLTGINPIISTFFFVALAVVPFAALGMTSFLKLNVVFSILRNAIGAGQLPSAAIVGLISIVLTMQIMAPVAHQIKEALVTEPGAPNAIKAHIEASGTVAGGVGKKKGLQAKAKAERGREPRDVAGKPGNVAEIIEAVRRASVPLEAFLRKHSHERERAFFASLSGPVPAIAPETAPQIGSGVPDNRKPDNSKEERNALRKVPEENLWSLLPAFVISELQEAFSVGLMILLPFLVIDLIVTNILVALGMTMVTPVTVALPFKLLLFVLCDGWFVICRGLILSYQ